MPDFRDRWLFVAGVEMNWLVIPRVSQRELFALVRQVGGWTEGTTPPKVHAVCRTAREAAAGKRVAFAGVDGTLAIASETKPSVSGWRSRARRSREIKTIISDDERRRRDRKRGEEHPREAGAMIWQEYLVRSAERCACSPQTS